MRHSPLRFPGLLGAVVIMLALHAPAHAGTVDWSSYIDHSAPAKAAPATAAPAKASRAKVSRASKKIARAKVKARPKKASRRK